MAIFIDLRGETDKAASLIPTSDRFRSHCKEIDTSRFRSLPGSPFAYRASDKVLECFQDLENIETSGFEALGGLKTQGDFRFLRLGWEIVGNPEQVWFPLCKGGEFSVGYQDVHLRVRWDRGGVQLREYYAHISEGQGWGGFARNEKRYFSPGVTWSRRPHKKGSFRLLPPGVIFGSDGPAVFCEDYLSLCAIMNSSAFLWLLGFLMARGESGGQTLKFEVGYVSNTPLPKTTKSDREKLSKLMLEFWKQRYLQQSTIETDAAFLLPLALRSSISGFETPAIESRLADIQAEIDDIAFDLYNFSDADRAAALCSSGAEEEEDRDGAEDPNESEDENSGELIGQTDALLSWAIGVAFGRFDWRLATGERDAPPEPDPFNPLQVKSPGMLPDDAAPFHEHNGILVDDQGHPHDLPRLIEEIFARVDAEIPGDVRRWLQRDFFALHQKQYSKSRRKAPIYWPLSTASGSYTLWLYYPGLTGQTLYIAVNDFVEPKLKQVSRDTATLRDKGTSRSRDDEKAFEALQSLELELIELRDILLQIAPTYHPNHDDGVQITASPLWQLFRHKPWQNILKDTWAMLEKGEYDWAHLAMAYWPERVREKCKTDKSLAVAHDLEALYVEPAPRLAKARGKKGVGA
jgi:hypothetical protein